MNKRNLQLTLEEAKKLYSNGTEEIKSLLLSSFTKEELEKKELPKTWDELEKVEGYYITNYSHLYYNYGLENNKSHKEKRNVFATQKQALSALAMAQLSQLMKVYNDGWEPDWDNQKQFKYIIRRCGNFIETNLYTFYYHFLAFKDSETRDLFLKNFESLIKQYFMID